MSRQTPPKRLGRGLDSLVTDLRHDSRLVDPPTRNVAASTEQRSEARRTESAGARSVATDALEPNPYQPRAQVDLEELMPLAESIRQNGILQPILVRRDGARFQIIAGERRWSAAKHAGLAEVPVIVRDANDQQMLELALIENIQREDLNPLDRAVAYRRYCAEFGLSADQVATRIGENRSTVANYMRLLDLPDAIRSLIASGTLSMGHGRCLLGIATHARQVELAAAIQADDLSVRALEHIVRQEKVGEPGTPVVADQPPVSQKDAHLRDIERRLEEAVKTKVTIRQGRGRGRGRIIIEYYSLDDFDRIAEQLGIAPEVADERAVER